MSRPTEKSGKTFAYMAGSESERAPSSILKCSWWLDPGGKQKGHVNNTERVYCVGGVLCEHSKLTCPTRQ